MGTDPGGDGDDDDLFTVWRLTSAAPMSSRVRMEDKLAALAKARALVVDLSGAFTMTGVIACFVDGF